MTTVMVLLVGCGQAVVENTENVRNSKVRDDTVRNDTVGEDKVPRAAPGERR